MSIFFQKLIYATGCVFELARGVIVFAVILGLVNSFVAMINIVNGPSMEPNFQDKQLLVVDKISYLLRAPRRGEAVILKFPGDPDKTRYIKRIVGLPGEMLSIVDNKVYINGRILKEPYLPDHFRVEPNLQITIGPDEYFVMGDNRENSNDSRVFKTVERRFLIGLAYLIIYPFSDASLVPPQYYNL